MNFESERERKIRERAHQIWEQEGRPEGREEEHWHRAEQEIAATEPTATSESRRAKPAASPTRSRRKGASETATAGKGPRRRTDKS